MCIRDRFAGALFGNSAWVATSAYFIGVAAVIISGIILKKFKAFAGEPAPFVMELPAYHAPSAGNVLRSMWERGWSFIKRAGTVILLSTIVLWFLQGFGFENGAFGMVEDNNNSILANIGNAIAWIFAPLGLSLIHICPLSIPSPMGWTTCAPPWPWRPLAGREYFWPSTGR